MGGTITRVLTDDDDIRATWKQTRLRLLLYLRGHVQKNVNRLPPRGHMTYDNRKNVLSKDACMYNAAEKCNLSC